MKEKQLARASSADDLLEIQRAFAGIIRRPLLAGDKMARDPLTEQMVLPSETLKPHERMELYACQYWWRVKDSLDDDFPLLIALLGRDCYNAVRDAYLEAYPSTSFTLRNLGRDFTKFLNTTSLLSEELRGTACDCSRLEWAIIEAFDGKTIAPLSQEIVTSEEFAYRRLQLQPFIKLLNLSFPINRLLAGSSGREGSATSNTRLHRRQDELEDVNGETASASKVRLVLSTEPTWLAVHRIDFRVYVKPISEIEFGLLLPFISGCSLEEWSSSIGVAGQDPDELQRAFRDSVSLGWLGLSERHEDVA